MKISSLLGEASTENKAALPIDKDLLYKARQKYPQYSGEQALTLYIADEMKEKDKIDSNQNRLIDTQKRENERLRSVVDNLGQTVEQEIQQVAQQAEINDNEISRIKQLTGQLSQGGTDTQRKAKVSGDDLEKLQKELEQLKTKPGMDPEKFNQLKKQIETMVSNPSIDNKELAKINSLVNTLTQQRQVGDDLYKKVEDQLIKTKQDLDDKEGRFSKYIEKKKGEIGGIQKQNADEIKKYSDIVQSYQQDIEKFNTQVQKLNKDREFINNEKQIMIDLRGEVQQNAETIQQNADGINKDAKEAAELLTFIKQLYSKNIKDVDDTPSTPNADDITPDQDDQDDIKVYKGNIPSSDYQATTDTEPSKQKDNVVPFPTQAELAGLYANKDGKGGTVDATTDDKSANNDDGIVGYDHRAKLVKTGTNESLLEYETTTFKIYKNWGDPRFNKWMKDNLSMLITLFKNKFREELSNKDPKYSDGQISYSIQEEAWYLKEIFENKEDSILTREKMDSYLTLVKRTLFSQPSNPTLHMQPNNELFNESLDKTYSRMLDDIINLAYIKKG
jgi:uncharacterized protein YigA (DUF484 family)